MGFWGFGVVVVGGGGGVVVVGVVGGVVVVGASMKNSVFSIARSATSISVLKQMISPSETDSSE